VLPILMRYGLWLLGFRMLAALLMAGLTQSNRDSRSSALAAETAPADESASERPRTYEQLPGVVHMLPEALPIERLQDKPLYEFTELDLAAYLEHLSDREADPIARVMHLARKNIGQPYKLFLLGEFPFETHDPDPLYCLTHSDCVTFCEHTYAMALSRGWESFFLLLQRLRYKDGQIGIRTRNHEMTSEWNQHNAWLFEDICRTLGGGKQWVDMLAFWSPREFFHKMRLPSTRPDVEWPDVYIPRARVPNVLPDLRNGDMVNVIRGDERHQLVAHVGMIGLNAEGNVYLIHSANPQVREEPLLAYLQKDARILGFKFLRLRPLPDRLVREELARTRVGPALMSERAN